MFDSSIVVSTSVYFVHDQGLLPSCIASISKFIHVHAEIVECHNVAISNSQNKVIEGMKRQDEKIGIYNLSDRMGFTVRDQDEEKALLSDYIEVEEKTDNALSKGR